MTATSTTLWLELTPRCNLSCAFCYNPWREGPKSAYPEMLAHSDFVAAIDRLVRRRKFSCVVLSGGEPLLYPKLDSLVGLLAGAGQRTILTTNGRLLTRRRVSALTASGLSAIQVPLLAATPSVHDHLSGRSSWEQAIRALALGLEAGISSAATFVATASNVDELPLVAGLLREIGVRHLVVNEMHPEGSARGRTELATEPSLLRDALARAKKSAAGGGLQVSFIPAGEAGRHRPVAGWGRLAVTPNAELKLCNQSELTLGSLAELSDRALDRLLYGLSTDVAASYRDRVDRCRCFDRMYGRQGGRDEALLPGQSG